MVKRILAVLGGTPYAQNAIRHAVTLAQAHDARVTGITILDPEAQNVARLGIEAVRERIDANVSELEEAARKAGIDHQVIREKGEPVQAMCAEGRYHDLTVLGLRGLFQYGVVAEPEEAVSRLIRSGLHPILTVPKTHVPIRRVVIAYSGSLESAASMRHFAQLRLWPNASMHLIYFTSGEEEKKSWQPLLDDSAAYFADWGIDLEVEARIGGARENLLGYAKELQADLIVMGDNSKSLLTRRLFGDTVEYVIRSTNRSLFISH